MKKKDQDDASRANIWITTVSEKEEGSYEEEAVI